MGQERYPRLRALAKFSRGVFERVCFGAGKHPYRAGPDLWDARLPSHQSLCLFFSLSLYPSIPLSLCLSVSRSSCSSVPLSLSVQMCVGVDVHVGVNVVAHVGVYETRSRCASV